VFWYWWLITVLFAGGSFTFGLTLGWRHSHEREKELDSMLTRAEEINDKLNEWYRQRTEETTSDGV
jgi:hypothetical protein